MKIAGTTLIAICALLVAAGCSGGDTSYAESHTSDPLLVYRSTFQTSIRLSGMLRAADSASISSPQGARGVSIRWMAEDGSLVKEGDKVLEIDNSAITSTLESNKNALLAAQNDLLQQRNTSSINIAEKEHAVQQASFTLRKASLDAAVPRDAYPRRVYEDMQLAHDSAKREHEAAKKALQTERRIAALALEQKELALTKAERNITSVLAKLDEYTLEAPRDGILVAAENWQEGRSFRTGDNTWPGQVILEIPNLSVMNVEAELSDVDDGRLHIGMPANCVLDAYPELSFPATIESISPVAQSPGSKSLRRAFKVMLKLERTDSERMRPGMSVQVQALDKEQPDSLLIPRAALRFGDDAVMALLASDEEKPVVIGRCSASECILESGLAEGTALARRANR